MPPIFDPHEWVWGVTYNFQICVQMCLPTHVVMSPLDFEWRILKWHSIIEGDPTVICLGPTFGKHIITLVLLGFRMCLGFILLVSVAYVGNFWSPKILMEFGSLCPRARPNLNL